MGQPQPKKKPARPLRTASASASERPTTEAIVARQAILDRTGKVLGYQLLFRDALMRHDNVVDPHRATATVILNTLVHLGLERVVGEHRMFVEIPEKTLLDDYAELLPSDRVVLQIPAVTEPSIAVRSAISCLRGRGYKIALSRFSATPGALSLLELADFVKIDVLSATPAEIEKVLAELRPALTKAIADRVETLAQYEACRALGFVYFQGHFLSDPQIVAGREPLAGTRVLELLRLFSDPRVTMDQIDEVVKSDVLLSYRLLRCLNSAAFGLPRRVRSVRHALAMLGHEHVRKWATVLALSANAAKPIELVRIALIRAQMCANLAAATRLDARVLFTVGLFSVLDALLDRPMAEVLASLDLEKELQRAILHGEGKAGEVLTCVVAYERGEWERAEQGPVPMPEVTSAWLRAVAAAARVLDTA